MRVVMAAACPYPTTQGTQVLIRGMVRALCRRGHEVHLVAYHLGEDLPAEGEVLHRIPRVPWYRKLRSGPSWGKPFLDGLLAGRLLGVVREVRPDLVHAHNYEAPIAAYAVRALTGVPVLYQSHNLMADELHLYVHGRAAQGLARSFAAVLDREVPRRADGCAVISKEALAAHVRLGVDPTRLHLLLPAVHPEDFEGPVPSPAGRTVVYAGNPDRYQDLHVLVAAMAIVVRRLPDARLLAVSSAGLGDVRALASRAGLPCANLDLRTTSSWEEAKAAMRQGTVAALPRGLCRGFPIKLLNYMALGLPVVACAGSARLLVDGESGIVVPDGDVHAFARALEHLLLDPEAARRMGRRAATSIMHGHCWERRVMDLEAIYGRVAGRPEPPSATASEGSVPHRSGTSLHGQDRCGRGSL